MTELEYTKRCEAMRNFREVIAEYETEAKTEKTHMLCGTTMFYKYTAYYIVKHFSYRIEVTDDIVESYIKASYDAAIHWNQCCDYRYFKKVVIDYVLEYAPEYKDWKKPVTDEQA